MSTNDMGRNVNDLLKLSNDCDVHIIAPTGFYLEQYHPQYIHEMDENAIAEIFIKDLTVGIDDSNIRAGVIGEVATSKVMTEDEKKVLAAAAIAGKKVGCCVSTHCQMGTLGHEQLDIFKEKGMPLNKVILGHIDLSNDIAYMKSLMDRGANIGFDTIGKTTYLKDESRADNLAQLIREGYVNNIILSADISRKSYMKTFGEYSGYTAVLDKFIPLLKERGICQDDIDHLLIKNPSRIFDIQ